MDASPTKSPTVDPSTESPRAGRRLRTIGLLVLSAGMLMFTFFVFMDSGGIYLDGAAILVMMAGTSLLYLHSREYGRKKDRINAALIGSSVLVGGIILFFLIRMS